MVRVLLAMALLLCLVDGRAVYASDMGWNPEGNTYWSCKGKQKTLNCSIPSLSITNFRDKNSLFFRIAGMGKCDGDEQPFSPYFLYERDISNLLTTYANRPQERVGYVNQNGVFAAENDYEMKINVLFDDIISFKMNWLTNGQANENFDLVCRRIPHESK